MKVKVEMTQKQAEYVMYLLVRDNTYLNSDNEEDLAGELVERLAQAIAKEITGQW